MRVARVNLAILSVVAAPKRVTKLVRTGKGIDARGIHHTVAEFRQQLRVGISVDVAIQREGGFTSRSFGDYCNMCFKEEVVVTSLSLSERVAINSIPTNISCSTFCCMVLMALSCPTGVSSSH